MPLFGSLCATIVQPKVGQNYDGLDHRRTVANLSRRRETGSVDDGYKSGISRAPAGGEALLSLEAILVDL